MADYSKHSFLQHNTNMKKDSIEPAVIEEITQYVYEHYKSYKNKQLIINERGNCFTILKHKDGSPLILSKGILK